MLLQVVEYSRHAKITAELTPTLLTADILSVSCERNARSPESLLVVSSTIVPHIAQSPFLYAHF